MTETDIALELATLRELNADLCERLAAASRALTQASEKQGQQAREIARLHKIIDDIVETACQQE